MTDLLDQGAAAVSSAIRAGKTSAHDVAEAAIARVEAKNKAITAIVDVDPAEARAAADGVDGRRKQGFDGPILGVPYTVKDTTWVQGRRLPVGLQIVAPRLHDRPLLAMAQRAEAAVA
jgi:Asp-tRNA(Asn)/Glu-tRNA(Gln) amidotransferase A subunit family amidase